MNFSINSILTKVQLKPLQFHNNKCRMINFLCSVLLAPVKCTRSNEVFDGCPPPCFNQKCADIGSPRECDLRFFSCHPQCICALGFCKDDADVCVPESEYRKYIVISSSQIPQRQFNFSGKKVCSVILTLFKNQENLLLCCCVK